MGRGTKRKSPGFTLVELLVVVSIIALLISILLPSLRKARDQAKAVKCAANTRGVGQGVSVYLAETTGIYPPSYVYPKDWAGSWSVEAGGQSTTKEFGYLHWSHFLYSNGKVHEKTFQCPSMQNGGAPRTNPGPDSRHWELGAQQDDTGQTTPSPGIVEDKQAPRMAYTANAAIMPRNKFTGVLSLGNRVNVLAREDRVKRPGDTILLADFLNNFRALSERQIGAGGKLIIKSHRPVNVFYSESGQYNEYLADASLPKSDFVYGLLVDPETYGVLPLRDIQDVDGLLDWTSQMSQINAVGRHHPGGDSKYGGKSNFLFLDGHAETITPLHSMQFRKWGDRYHALSGPNEIHYHPGQGPG
jgi:prepilin-type N-terminal cleavage/methylation domain-containing protein/prepilin-type processing-associated H-X9-DG protein